MLFSVKTAPASANFSFLQKRRFAAGVDTAYARLFTKAGHYLDDNGSAITLDADYEKEILAYMKRNSGRHLCRVARFEVATALAKATTKLSVKEFQEAKFQRGDGKGHTNWIDGSMVAIVPPEYQFYLGKLDDFKYS